VANEITSTVSFTVNKNSAQVVCGTTKQTDMAGENMIMVVQEFSGTTAAQILFTNITGVPSMLYLRNMDDEATFHVSFNADGTTSKFIILLPGQQALFPPGDDEIHGKFTTAPATLPHIQVGASEA
jgi:hypothetical protein